MKWVKSRNLFLEAKIRDVVFPKQLQEIKRTWGERFLDYEEIIPTDNIKQGVWKLSEEDKRKALSVFFQIRDLNTVYDIFNNLSDKFSQTLSKSINVKLLDQRNQRKWGGVLERFNIKNPSVDEIYLLFENVFRKISVGETMSDEIIEKDENGRPILGEDNKPRKRKKKKGEVVFSNNLVNVNTFISDYNRCYPEDTISSGDITGGDVSRIRNIAGEDLNNYEIDFDIFSRDMYLSIVHNPKDILNMSISKFYASCQHLYTGGYRSCVLGNVFDPNSIPAYLKFDVPIKNDGEIISDQLPVCRMMVRNIESFSTEKKGVKLFFDRCYPDRLESVFGEIIEKYSGNIRTKEDVSEYIFSPDIPIEDRVETPYMDRIRAKNAQYIGVNATKLYLTCSQDWSKTFISPKAAVKELIIETTNLPPNIFDLPFKLEWVKFKFVKINTLKDFKFKTTAIVFDKCKFDNELLDEIIKDFPLIKKLHIESCDVKDLDFSKFESLDELGLIYTLNHGEKLSELIGNKFPKKLIISGDILSTPENKEFVRKLRRSKINVEVIGLVI